MKKKSLQVMLVEDNPDDIVLAREMLREACPGEFTLTEISRLSTALKKLASETYDAVLLDLKLLDSIGLDTLAQMNAAFPQIPIIVLSGSNNNEMAMQAVQQGAQDFLVKWNVPGKALGRVIRYAIARKSTPSDAGSPIDSEASDEESKFPLGHLLQQAVKEQDMTKSSAALLFLTFEGLEQFPQKEGTDALPIFRDIVKRIQLSLREGDRTVAVGQKGVIITLKDQVPHALLTEVGSHIVRELGRPFLCEGVTGIIQAKVGLIAYPLPEAKQPRTSPTGHPSLSSSVALKPNPAT